MKLVGIENPADPEYIIEFKKDMYIDCYRECKIKKGEKLIYIIGERSGQWSLLNFLFRYLKQFEIVKKAFFDYSMLPVENCMGFMEKYVVPLFTRLERGFSVVESDYIKITKFKKYRNDILDKEERKRNFFNLFPMFNESVRKLL